MNNNLKDIKRRFQTLYYAIKNLFTGKEIVITKDMCIHNSEGISAQHWIERNNILECWTITFDGKEAKGYINGEPI